MKFNDQNGFTLIEVLIALAITSLASLALFQSMSMWVIISGKTTQAAQRAISGTVQDTQLRTIISGMTSSWPNETRTIFKGEASSISGLTTNQLHLETPTLNHVTLEIENNSEETRLNYIAEDTSWIMKRTPQGRSSFDFLGADGIWYEQWPPNQTPEPGPFRDSDLYDTPQLPLAIRLTTQTGNLTDILIADISNDPALPVRESDILRTLLGTE